MQLKKYSFRNLFASPVMTSSLDLNLEKLTEFVLHHKNIDSIGGSYSNRGGWHSKELIEESHDEFDKLNITIENLKDKINKKEVFYNHFADKEIKNKWSDSYKLKKIDISFLPKYLNDNHEKFNEWFDT